jgi:hypothetical protein
MLAIVISACLVTDPGVCKNYRLPLALDIDPAKCALWAPPHFAQWSEEHPGWQIRRWRCTTKASDDI